MKSPRTVKGRKDPQKGCQTVSQEREKAGRRGQTIWGSKAAEVAPNPLWCNIMRTLLQSGKESLVGALIENISDRFRADVVAGEMVRAVIAGELTGETVRTRVLTKILDLEIGKGPIDHAVIARFARVVMAVATEAGLGVPNRRVSRVLPIEGPVPISGGLSQ